jgi:hypothetical protein
MISATIENSFSAGYSIQAVGDGPTRIPTAILTNLSFRLLDANFIPVKLLNPLYLTISVNPCDVDPNELGDMQIPKNSPTSAQKALMDVQARMDAELKAQADAKAKERADTKMKALQLIVQYLKPLVEKQQPAYLRKQQEQQKQANMLALLQDQSVMQELQGMDPEAIGPYLEQLAEQMQEKQEEQYSDDEEEAVAVPVPPQIAPVMWNAEHVDKDF